MAVKPNIDTGGLREYIEVFLSKLEETAKAFWPEQRSDLLHLSLLPARIIGYVSTQHGVGFEYLPAKATSIETRLGSSRIEDFLLGVPLHLQNAAVGADVSGARNTFQQCSFSNLRPLRLSSASASVILRDVTCTGRGWHRQVEYAELYGSRAANRWSREAAVSDAKDEVLAALTELNIARRRGTTLPDFISGYKAKMVLLLGDYGPSGIERLTRMKEALCGHGYEPIMVRDVPDVPEQHMEQKVALLGALARFVVVDDSSKSGHLFELAICKTNSWITVILRSGGIGPTWMTANLASLSSVICEMPYNPEDIQEGVKRAADWAEAKIEHLRKEFNSTYPWRPDYPLPTK